MRHALKNNSNSTFEALAELELNLEVRCQSPNRACVFTFSGKLEKWSVHFAGRAKLLFLFIKYAKFVALSRRRRVEDLKLPICGFGDNLGKQK